MNRKFITLLAATSLISLGGLVGCDDTISKDETVKTKSDGTVVHDKKEVKERPDGTVVKEETHTADKP